MNGKEMAPVFVVGMPRSGTTLLSNMLNASKQVFIGPETHLYPLYTNWIRKKNSLSFADFYFKENPFIVYFDYSDQEIKALYDKAVKETDPSKILKIVCEHAARTANIDRWGEKTPDHLFSIKKITEDFPHAKILNIMRDPRDVYMSTLRADWGESEDKLPYFFWKKYKKNNRLVRSYVHNACFLTIKYEDIISSPKKLLPEICAFLEIEYKPEMITAFQSSENLNFNSKKEPWKANNAGGLKSGNFSKWKTDKKNFDLHAYLSKKLKTEIDFWGYESLDFSSTLKYAFLEMKYGAAGLKYKIKNKLKKIY